MTPPERNTFTGGCSLPVLVPSVIWAWNSNLQCDAQIGGGSPGAVLRRIEPPPPWVGVPSLFRTLRSYYYSPGEPETLLSRILGGPLEKLRR